MALSNHHSRRVLSLKAKYGDDFFVRLGSKGGKISRTGGFYGNPEAASKAGRIGGLRRKWTEEQKLRQRTTFLKTMELRKNKAQADL
jgi:general stress protein YciG